MIDGSRRPISWRLPQICGTSGNTPLEQECWLLSIVKGERHICHTLDFYWEISLNIPTTIVGDDYFCHTSHANKIFRYWMMLRTYIHPKKFPMKQSEFLNHSLTAGRRWFDNTWDLPKRSSMRSVGFFWREAGHFPSLWMPRFGWVKMLGFHLKICHLFGGHLSIRDENPTQLWWD